MAFGADRQLGKHAWSFNMTSLIDIVFLLIVFFVVVSQFIEAENFSIKLPDNCRFAEDQIATVAQFTTVSVFKNNVGEVEFAVGDERIASEEGPELVERIGGLINDGLKAVPAENRTVTLRIDKDISFRHAQYALVAIAESKTQDIRIAVLKERITEND